MGTSRRLLLTLAALVLGALAASGAHAEFSSARARTRARFKSQCDNDGSGKACYDYGRALWNDGGAANHKTALKYLHRGCELKYDYACKDYDAHSGTSKRAQKHTKTVAVEEGRTGACFSPAEMDNAKFYPNMVSATAVEGQLIANPKPKSFWDRVGFVSGDIIMRINNTPFNSAQKAPAIFGEAGKRLSFQVERNHEVITLWYNCI